MPTITDYVTKATTATILSTMYASAEIVALKVSSWAAGAVARTIFAVVAPVIRAYSDVNTEAIKGGLLDFAEGLWLDALGVGVYDTERIDVTFATTNVTFNNPTGDLFDEAAGDVVVSAGALGPTYRTTGQLYLTPGATNVVVGVRAEIAGTGSNAAVGAINTMVIGPQGVTLTNAAAALATDREEDDAYRERCRLAMAATSPMGSKDAYRYVATSAVRANGSAIGITKVAVISDGTTGDVEVFLADADGEPDPADVTIIDALLEETVVPHGINWLGASGATEVEVDIEGTIVVRDADGLSDDDITGADGIVPAALAELQTEWPIGGYIIPPAVTGVLPIDEIRARISQAQALPTDPRPVIRVTLTSPAGDVTLAEGEVFKVGNIDLTIVRI